MPSQSLLAPYLLVLRLASRRCPGARQSGLRRELSRAGLQPQGSGPSNSSLLDSPAALPPSSLTVVGQRMALIAALQASAFIRSRKSPSPPTAFGHDRHGRPWSCGFWIAKAPRRRPSGAHRCHPSLGFGLWVTMAPHRRHSGAHGCHPDLNQAEGGGGRRCG